MEGPRAARYGRLRIRHTAQLLERERHYRVKRFRESARPDPKAFSDPLNIEAGGNLHVHLSANQNGSVSVDESELPNPPIGIFDAAPYQRYWPGPAKLVRGNLEKIPASPRSILIVGLTAVGDVLHFLPVACALRARFPKARIGWAVQDKARVIVEGRPDLDRVHVFERFRWARGLISPWRLPGTISEILAFKRELADERYELLLDVQGTIKSAMINWISGVPIRVGFEPPLANELNHLSTNYRVALPTRRIHRSKRALGLLQGIGMESSGPQASYLVPEKALSEVDSELNALDLSGRRYVLIHPGTSARGAWRRWPLERFAAVAKAAGSALGLKPLFALGPVERAWKKDLQGCFSGSEPRIVEPSSLAHLAAFLKRAACFFGCDSGPLHLASSMSVPTVGLYGPTDPALCGPVYPPAVLVLKGLKCPKCGANHCKHDVPRMESITVPEAVRGLELLQELISSGKCEENRSS